MRNVLCLGVGHCTAGQACSKMDIPMPLTALIRQLYGAMIASGRGELDYFGLLAQMEEMAGIKS